MAAEGMGDRESATAYYRKLIELAGDASRPELTRAKAYVAQR